MVTSTCLPLQVLPWNTEYKRYPPDYKFWEMKKINLTMPLTATNCKPTAMVQVLTNLIIM